MSQAKGVDYAGSRGKRGALSSWECRDLLWGVKGSSERAPCVVRVVSGGQEETERPGNIQEKQRESRIPGTKERE